MVFGTNWPCYESYATHFFLFTELNFHGTTPLSLMTSKCILSVIGIKSGYLYDGLPLVSSIFGSISPINISFLCVRVHREKVVYWYLCKHNIGYASAAWCVNRLSIRLLSADYFHRNQTNKPSHPHHIFISM